MMYRKREGHIETFLVHPGGPYWTQKVVIVDAGSTPAERSSSEADDYAAQAGLHRQQRF